MFTKTLKLGLIAALGIVGIVTAGQLRAGEPQVVATIQTGPEWEMLPRGEPLTVPEVHYRVKHSPYKSELVRYGQFIFNDASWGLQGEYACAS
ncbi:MAG: heme transporter CcmC, partial [Planctomycetota bacterium]|nr:heme transporter CcmC [Planctomycetota bacterium]